MVCLTGFIAQQLILSVNMLLLLTIARCQTVEAVTGGCLGLWCSERFTCDLPLFSDEVWVKRLEIQGYFGYVRLLWAGFCLYLREWLCPASF